MKTRHVLGAVLGLGLMSAPGPWIRDVEAGTLAQLQLQASSSKLRAIVQQHLEVCVGVARSSSCRAAFETALRQTSQPSATRGRLYESMSANRVPLASDEIDVHAHQIVLKFNEDPEWKRQAKVLAHDGLPFVRMPQGANRELLVGITPRGLLGVSLKDTTGE